MNADGEEKTDFVKIGRAFKLREADGMRLELYCSPPEPTHETPTSLVLLKHESRDR